MLRDIKTKVLYYLLSIISIIVLLFGLGYVKNWSNKNIIVGIIFFSCYIVGKKNKYTLITLLATFSILAFYFPTGIIYGIPTPEILGPLLQTNKLEILGYLKAIKYEILVSVVFIFLQILIYRIVKNNKFKKNYHIYIIFLFFYIISLFGISIHHYKLNQDAFLKNSIAALKKIHRQKEEQKMELEHSNDIKVEGRIDENDNTQIRVVIIGESVRRDYMSVYGYPHNTTPFLNSVNGIFIDGLVSVAPNTEQSLSRTLFKTIPSKNKIHWGINVISLANKAGYETYWISNQGTNKWGDNIFFALSKLATHANFLKEGDFESGDNDDSEMLPIFSNIINTNTNNKVIFIHMVGSHPPVCTRLNNYEPSFKINNEAACYAASIQKLDLFIKRITETLEGKNYKLMYFSDHGVAVSKNRVYHHANLYEAYQVPLFYLDSKMKEHVYLKKRISSLNLMDIYSTFINIKTNITNHDYNFKTISEINDNPDPIIYWEKYKHLSNITFQQSPVTDIDNSTIKHILVSKHDYIFSDECMSYIDYVRIAYPSNSNIYKIGGWGASTQKKEPLHGIVGTFVISNKKVFFVESYQEPRSDVREHFKLSKDKKDHYGMVSFIEKKYLNNKENIYFGFKDKSNHYTICNKP
jgi:glucan phosphoethanolaminetransferase (alkaline phosphatase superfamily)